MFDIREEIKKIREIKDEINFIQIGAYDGESIDDIGYEILNNNDRGLFIEPNPFIIEKLKENKNNFINSKILDFAIIPDENFYHENFHVQIDGGGSSFVRGLYNGNKSPEEKFKVLEVKIMTVKDLIENYVDFEIDFLLTDCEGYDFDINKKIIEINKPKIIHMEAWDTKDLHLSQKITTRDEMCEFLENNGYEIYFNKIGENLICRLDEKNN